MMEKQRYIITPYGQDGLKLKENEHWFSAKLVIDETTKSYELPARARYQSYSSECHIIFIHKGFSSEYQEVYCQ